MVANLRYNVISLNFSCRAHREQSSTVCLCNVPVGRVVVQGLEMRCHSLKWLRGPLYNISALLVGTELLCKQDCICCANLQKGLSRIICGSSEQAFCNAHFWMHMYACCQCKNAVVTGAEAESAGRQRERCSLWQVREDASFCVHESTVQCGNNVWHVCNMAFHSHIYLAHLGAVQWISASFSSAISMRVMPSSTG